MRTIKQTCRIEKGLIIILAVFCAVKIKETYYECCCLKWHDTQKLNMNFPYRFKRRFYWVLCDMWIGISFFFFLWSISIIIDQGILFVLLTLLGIKMSTKSPSTNFCWVFLSLSHDKTKFVCYSSWRFLLILYFEAMLLPKLEINF